MHSRTLVLAIGVEECQLGQLESVAYAENDARGFAQAWLELGVANADCATVLGPSATKGAIESTLKKLLKGTTTDDTFVFFYAGHVLPGDTAGYFGLSDTKISLAGILKKLSDCQAGKVLLFLDPEGEALSVEALEHFADGSADRSAFVSCGPGESSLKSTKLAHGIWSHAVIQALQGNAKAALADGKLIISESLQEYLADAVPQLIRSNRSGKETQTPRRFGQKANDTVIANFAENSSGNSTALGDALKDTFLRGVKFGLVRNLSGFQKGHRVPDRHFGATENFVRKIGHEKVQQQADTIFKDLRAVFAYRRKETVYDCVDGAATIKTPDFDVDLSIAQDPADPGGYTTTVEIGNIRTPEVVLSQEFSDVFSDHCDTVVISLSRPLDVEEKIDDIEANASLRGFLDYDAECTSFTLKLQSPNITIHVTENEITLQLRGAKELSTLLQGLQTALGTLHDSGVLELSAAGE